MNFAGPLISVHIDQRKSGPRIASLKRKINAIKTGIHEMKVVIWDRVNREIEKAIFEAFVDFRRQTSHKSAEAKAATQAWKRRAVKRGHVPWGTEVPLSTFIGVYGRVTGFFEEKLAEHQAIGTSGMFIRDVSSSPSVRGGRFKIGLALGEWGSGSHRGWPYGILKPKSTGAKLVSRTAERAMISIGYPQQALVGRILRRDHLQAVIRRAGFKG
jgi:hypothetical protein